jgi:hypothetical protein
MREPVAIGQFRRRLVEMGCPSNRLSGMVREFADHYEDLKQAGLKDGLSERDSEAHAATQLGDSIFHAEQTMGVLRRSTWWGRHPVIGFCMLPFLALAPAWAFCGCALAGICWMLGRIFGPRYTFDRDVAHALGSDPSAFQSFAAPIDCALMFSATLLVTFVFLWLAHRASLGLKWKLIACAVCAFNTAIMYATIKPSAIFVGYGWPPPNWIFTVIPLLAAISVFFRRRTMENCFPAVPEN